MTAEAIRDQGQPGDSGPPPVSKRARRVRMI